jgi:hypothetical protein
MRLQHSVPPVARQKKTGVPTVAKIMSLPLEWMGSMSTLTPSDSISSMLLK